MKEQEISRRITNILRNDFANSDEVVTDQTRLFHDLQIYGDDAVELLAMIGKACECEMSEFPFNEYFPEEAPFFALQAWINPSMNKHIKELTVAELTRLIFQLRKVAG